MYAFGDSLRLSAMRFLPSQEWDKRDSGFRRNGVFYIFGYRQIQHCPQKQKNRHSGESRNLFAIRIFSRINENRLF
ncbi:MAG: hypothetical protein ACR2QC_03405 [Gammaproteobacteria bacterium]